MTHAAHALQISGPVGTRVAAHGTGPDLGIQLAQGVQRRRSVQAGHADSEQYHGDVLAVLPVQLDAFAAISGQPHLEAISLQTQLHHDPAPDARHQPQERRAVGGVARLVVGLRPPALAAWGVGLRLPCGCRMGHTFLLMSAQPNNIQVVLDLLDSRDGQGSRLDNLFQVVTGDSTSRRTRRTRTVTSSTPFSRDRLEPPLVPCWHRHPHTRQQSRQSEGLGQQLDDGRFDVLGIVEGVAGRGSQNPRQPRPMTPLARPAHHSNTAAQRRSRSSTRTAGLCRRSPSRQSRPSLAVATWSPRPGEERPVNFTQPGIALSNQHGRFRDEVPGLGSQGRKCIKEPAWHILGNDHDRGANRCEGRLNRGSVHRQSGRARQDL